MSASELSAAITALLELQMTDAPHQPVSMFCAVPLLQPEHRGKKRGRDEASGVKMAALDVNPSLDVNSSFYNIQPTLIMGW